ncbi:phosphatidate cytidylyltransferase [Branchiibius hedensis]|uniref:Phosphatidate cytidylyltransferase n=1 Tax=Branchiibius hedensis TaxID=672460 RepID=A0A2Y8ZQJ4_9MICO|nr:phosphatidate cytidylyltransferase [Branchiibius hedensis]PWJ25838.1 phosphatidate cytidylyltransferase [Branchiibius hedensis]SSA34651.1 phosphatidate cytidylyltransferase [Branchiibius hedensis]
MNQPHRDPATRRRRREQTEASPAAPTAPNPTPRAGRNLYAAVGVGIGLGLLVLISLFTRKEIFLAVACAASAVAVWELHRAMAHRDFQPPVISTYAGSVLIPVVAYVWGKDAFASAIVLVLVAVIVEASIVPHANAQRNAAVGALITLYVPALVGFAALLLKPEDGDLRIATFILVVICSDIGGYAVGVVFGKHPMAPSVSPKKSWEGFAGSATACLIGGVFTVTLLLHGRWWVGLLLGACVVVTATIGDLCESVIKRDLGVKDMSNLIPGHGGLMDRLDSLLVSVPVVWAILTVLVPS